ncbi:phage tail protein [Clostridioides difficile]|uniref:phage tail-collar fiber domain-containing protein n=1 Tax=Clostridioides difficile TaxID=1496 RepID=UPI001F2F2815|nr:phage tail protein [Clostridioides difficile]
MAIDKSYYTIITDVGKAKIANASVTGNKVGFVKIQLGDEKLLHYNYRCRESKDSKCKCHR